MQVEKLLRDYNIPYENQRPGWTNIRCPHCADHGLHMGIADNGIPNCWRCGVHKLVPTLAALLSISESQAVTILREYKAPGRRKAKEIKRKPRVKSHQLPTDTTKLNPRHRKYLQKRNYDPDKLIHDWGLLGTGPISKLDKTNYSHRIVAPILWDGEQVSFQARDITDKHPVKYLACPKERELIEHQTILYGDQTKWTETGICVEGITDVWRLGPNSFCTFGIDFTHPQVRQISKHFSRILIAFDPEPVAQKQARKLRAELQLRGKEVELIDLKTDPGDMTASQAKQLVKRFY